MLDAIKVAFKAEAIGIRYFVARPAARADRTRRARRHRRVELGLSLLAPSHAPADKRVRAGMRALNDGFLYLHTARLLRGCDTYAHHRGARKGGQDRQNCTNGCEN